MLRDGTGRDGWTGGESKVLQEVLADLKILLTALRARGDLLPEKISGGKVGEAVLGHNLVALGALATKKGINKLQKTINKYR